MKPSSIWRTGLLDEGLIEGAMAELELDGELAAGLVSKLNAGGLHAHSRHPVATRSTFCQPRGNSRPRRPRLPR